MNTHNSPVAWQSGTAIELGVYWESLVEFEEDYDQDESKKIQGYFYF